MRKKIPITLKASSTSERLHAWLHQTVVYGGSWILVKPLHSEQVEVTFALADWRVVIRAWRQTRKLHQGDANRPARLMRVPVSHTKAWGLIQKLMKPWLWIPAILIVGIVLFMRTLIWDVQIEGGSVERKMQVSETLNKLGIRTFERPPAIVRADPDLLAGQIQQYIPELSWVTIKREGTRLHIGIEESVTPSSGDDPSRDSSTSNKSTRNGPADLIARTDAVVATIDLQRGRLLVRRHQAVRKGELLASGVIGNEARPLTVGAAGTIYGVVWYEVRVSVPLQVKQQLMTGERTSSIYWFVGPWTFGRPPSDGGQIRIQRRPLEIGPWKFPFGWMEEQHWKTRTENQKRSKQEAYDLAVEMSQNRLRIMAGKEAKLRHEKVLHVQWDRDKVILTILYEMEEQISVARPVVHPFLSPVVPTHSPSPKGAQPNG